MATSDTKARLTGPFVVLVVVVGLASGLWYAGDQYWRQSKPVEVVAAGVAGGAVAPAAVTGGPERARGDGAAVRCGAGGAAGAGGHCGACSAGCRGGCPESGSEVARARADAGGSFVALPAEPMKPGGRELTLTSRTAGAAEVKGGGSVVLVVPAGAATPSAAAEPSLALLVPEAAVPRVLRGAGPGCGGCCGAGCHGRLGWTTTVTGAIRFTGGAPAGSVVRVYIDMGAAGDARVDAGGRWSLTPEGAVAAGVHTIRADMVGGDGRVLARVELPFQRAEPTAGVAGARGGAAGAEPVAAGAAWRTGGGCSIG